MKIDSNLVDDIIISNKSKYTILKDIGELDEDDEQFEKINGSTLIIPLKDSELIHKLLENDDDDESNKQKAIFSQSLSNRIVTTIETAILEYYKKYPKEFLNNLDSLSIGETEKEIYSYITSGR